MQQAENFLSGWGHESHPPPLTKQDPKYVIILKLKLKKSKIKIKNLSGWGHESPPPLTKQDPKRCYNIEIKSPVIQLSLIF